MPRRSARLSRDATDPKKPKEELLEKRNKLGIHEGRTSTISNDDANASNEALKVKEAEISIVKVDYLETNNKKRHFTEDFELDDLIVRRGQAFEISIEFSGDVDIHEQELLLQFIVGKRPKQPKGTLLRISVRSELDASGETVVDAHRWTAHVTSVESRKINVVVTPSAHAIIGKYHTFVELTSQKKEWQIRKEVDRIFYLLFNPFCKEDAVYMEREDHRKEYVLNDMGLLYRGSKNNFRPMKWEFGQFDKCVLPVTFAILDKAGLQAGGRTTPVLVTRALSRIVNSMDDEGVLEGNWSKDMPPPCTLPWQWSSSVDILQQYRDTGSPVRYGQCWVFSAVTTTLCRALGIPTRSVTNFASAHDTDCSNTIDSHWTPEGEPVEDLNDSVWNFHVWNEGWFQRPDLPAGNDGWQAFDGTPQEASEGIMQCGPAPVKAIKEGNVYLPHDASFIFSEVNGDRVHWEVEKDGSMKVKYIQRHAVGYYISAKGITDQRDDLTLDYKFPEGSKEERAAVKRAYAQGTRAAEYDLYEQGKEDVCFELKMPEDASYGENFTVKIYALNSSDAARSVSGRLTAVTGRYTGVCSKRLFSRSITLSLSPGQEVEEEVVVQDDSYEMSTRPDAAIFFFLKMEVTETAQVFFHQDQFSFVPPPVGTTGFVVKSAERVEYGKTFDVEVSIKNWLKVKMTNLYVHVTGSSLVRNRLALIRQSLKAGEEVRHVFQAHASRAGRKRLLVTVWSDQAPELQDQKEVYVAYPE